jgi:hypothetical protein
VTASRCHREAQRHPHVKPASRHTCRQYPEADRGRADDYYLAEGNGVARRFVGHGERVEELAPLTAETYEAWVAGCDPGTGEPPGAAARRRACGAVRRGSGERAQVLVAGRRGAP